MLAYNVTEWARPSTISVVGHRAAPVIVIIDVTELTPIVMKCYAFSSMNGAIRSSTSLGQNSGSSLEKMPVYDQRQLVQASIYIKYNYTVTVTGTNGLLNGAHLSIGVGPFEYVQKP